MYRYLCMNQISEVGISSFTEEYTRTETLEDAHALLVRSADLHKVELPDSLLAIARAGAGVNNIPLEECSQKGIVVFNTPGANANGVKELVFAGMLLAARDIIGGANWVSAQEGNPAVSKDTEKEKKEIRRERASRKKAWDHRPWSHRRSGSQRGVSFWNGCLRI